MSENTIRSPSDLAADAERFAASVEIVADAARQTKSKRPTWVIDSAIKDAHSLVALVGTLTQEHDECKALGLVGWRERAQAAEAALAELKGVNDTLMIAASRRSQEVADMRRALESGVRLMNRNFPHLAAWEAAAFRWEQKARRALAAAGPAPEDRE